MALSVQTEKEKRKKLNLYLEQAILSSIAFNAEVDFLISLEKVDF
jgi:hypothetical protein